jgi:hypothetical protein
MKLTMRKVALSTLAFSVFTSCLPRPDSQGIRSGIRSRVSSIEPDAEIGVDPADNAGDVRNRMAASFRQMAADIYKLYLVDQTNSWKKTLYCFDEWNSYVATTLSAVEIQRAGRWSPSDNSDPIEGLVDLIYFSSAAIISIKNVDLQYLASNKQFKATYAMIM